VAVQRARVERSPTLTAAGATAIVALLTAAVSYKLGIVGLLAPLGVALAVLLVRRALLTVTLVTGLIILCEGPTFGVFTFSSHLYTKIYGDFDVPDALVLLMLLAIVLELRRSGCRLVVPRPLRLPSMLLALGMVVGAIAGRAGGGSLRFVIASEDGVAFLLLLPIAIGSMPIERRRAIALLYGATALAIVKALLGLFEVAGGYGQAIEGEATLTYREPTANWLIMIALLALLAAVVGRRRGSAAVARRWPPLWMLLGSPLLVVALLLSYRRSFWIAAALAVVLVVLLGLSPLGRRLLLPAGLSVALAVWLLGSLHFQSQLPLVKRALSLQPSSLETNVEDRYRLDERANVIGEIERHPITGLGMTVPWAATVRPLPIEHEGGREYVHFAALWFWLKLGVLGFLAYVGMLLGSMVLAWQAWRRSREPALRAFGLASLCGIVGLGVIETTATFTGVDARFTILLGVQIGLLALIARTASPDAPADRVA
jgi:O-antigen ligase/polysaccharide polymerase Wzy-like membrane protein